MNNRFFQKPQLFFFGIALVTLLTGLIYFRFYPEARIDLGGDYEFSASLAFCWLAISGYTFILSAIYYIASKGRLKMRRWLVLLHFIFLIVFLVLFLAFTSFDSAYVQDHISGLSFFTLILAYALIFLLDLIAFVIGLVLLIVNIFSFRRPGQ